MERNFRYYQSEADNAIYEELQQSDKCIVKMFCGTGKSLLMRKCKSAQNQALLVYVFPSLSLIDQFHTEYLSDCPRMNVLKISSESESESTTDPRQIKKFLSKKGNKIICITYQSYETLLENLGNIKINVCIFDEAHHAVGEISQKLIFENTVCEKQIFFTATPKNANGIIMHDRDNPDIGMCGALVYDYSYLRGVNDNDEQGKRILNPFDIRVDMYTENTNKSVYESIARAILISGNNRVLTFHSDVNTERDTSVNNFVNEADFVDAFMKVMEHEFPEKVGLYTRFVMVALDASIKMNDRRTILSKFDTALDNEVYIISSCETIGEGIDTKNANMCVFVDPKTSFVKIIQNIGRVVRPQSNSSTILIPCWVDKEKYIGCGEDREKRDEVIREDMSAGGNFNGILNVLSALRQEDEDIYDICLHYPDTYSPQEIHNHLEKQGYIIMEDLVGDGTLLETIGYVLDLDEDIDYEEYEDCDTDEEMILQLAEDNDVCIEIHTNSLETPVETYNSVCESGEIVRLYKDDIVYLPIVKQCGQKRTTEPMKRLDRKNRIRVDVHTNPDVKVLWRLMGDFTKDICSCVLDCEVVDIWYERLDEIKMFLHENKRTPNKRSINPSEKKMGTWVSNNQRNYKKKDRAMKNESKYNLWGQFLKEHESYFQNDHDRWYERLNETKIFLRDNKKRPSSHSKNSFEEKLGSWIDTQQTNYNNKKDGMKEANRYNAWTTFLEDYKEYFQDNHDKWYNTFETVKAFIDKNKKPPYYLSENSLEETLGHWIHTQQTNYNKKECSMKEMNRYNTWTTFLEDYKEYYQNNHDKWYDTFENVKVFIDENKKRPSTIAEDANEKFMGQWISQQNQKYKQKKHSMNDKNKYNLWTKFLDKYKKYFNKWFEHLENIKVFINKNKKNPSYLSENSSEKKLGQWRSQQQKYYKSKTSGMKDDTRYNAWTEFLKECKDYFSSNNSETQSSVSEQASSTSSESKIVIIKKKSMKLKPVLQNVVVSTTESLDQKKQRAKSELEILHQRYKTLNSQTLGTQFQENPDLWKTYHAISEENEQSFPEDDIPRNRIIQELNEIRTKRTRSIVDMGCGKGQIAEYFKDDKRFEFINYDHISSNDTIISCDISQTPLEEHAVEICILSLAMWGSNCHDYVREAHRILESGGKLYIIEATKRWSEKDEHGHILPEKEASKLKTLLEETGFQITKTSIEKFCLFICSKL